MSYNKTIWKSKDIITREKLQKIEDQLEILSEQENSLSESITTLSDEIQDISDVVTSTESMTPESIAIVADNNIHIAINAGQYVYVREHASLAEGLYMATEAIPANSTLSTTNLSVVSGGGLNALNNQITNLFKFYNVVLNNTGSLASGATITTSISRSSFLDTGYEIVAVIPRYGGDDQFVIVSAGWNSTEVTVMVRNVSASTDSGAPQVTVIAMKR